MRSKPMCSKGNLGRDFSAVRLCALDSPWTLDAEPLVRVDVF
jgi:hypothetical protein